MILQYIRENPDSKIALYVSADDMYFSENRLYNLDVRDLSKGSVFTKTALLALPFSETGDDLLCYLFFQSSTDSQLVSTSQYLGTLTA
jgi:hypothetical protein